MSEILFIAVPGGRIVNGEAPLQVVVVPRLTGTFADSGMLDWAAAVTAAQLTVERITLGLPTPMTPTRLSTPDAALWRATFPPTTLVRPFGLPDYGLPMVIPTAAHADAIDITYEQSAQAFAGQGPGAGAPDDVVRHQLDQWSATVVQPAPDRLAPPDFRQPDLHEVVARFREHPTVLRELGLILELSVPASFLAGDGGVRTVRVRWASNPLVVSPQTGYELTPASFLPVSRGDIAGGLVDLTRATWTTSTVDVDGAVGRLQAAAAAVAAGERPTLPTLRTAGVSVLRRHRDEVLAQRRTSALPVTEDTVLNAEQLVLGYRVDVREAGGEWRSLSSRRATYTVNGRPVGAPSLPEEGHIKANSMTSAGPGGQLRASDTVARWSGWSLVVPQPNPAAPRDAVSPQLTLDQDLRFTFEVEPGSLPSLRFGHSYKLRLRVADLAGGGHHLGDPEGDTAATGPVTYRRLEPVSSPLITDPPSSLVPGPTPGTFLDTDPGGGSDTLVLRSDPGMGAGLDAATFAAQNPFYRLLADRAMTPPRVALAIAEQHGELDGAADDGFDLVLRALADRSLPDPAAQGVVLFGRSQIGASGAGVQVDRSWSGRWPDRVPKILRLAAAEAGKPTIAFEGEVGVVRLPPAGQAWIEVSSLIEPDHVDHFEVSHWLRDVAGPIVSGGRHPMATPARLVHFVHAVRKPLTSPSGSFRAQRVVDGTDVVLVPSTPLLGVDPASTVQLDLAAAWDDWGDHPAPIPTTDSVPPVTIPLGAASLPELRHELGDTKHRRIRYTPTAVSRFRPFFAEHEDAAAFVAVGQPIAVDVLNTGRPPRPVVNSVTPSFAWSGTEVTAGWTRLERVRNCRRLRVELARPWFVTGQGEQLAAMTFIGAGLPPRGLLVTRAGRDPIWVSDPVLGLPGNDSFAGDSGQVQFQGGPIGVLYDVWFADGHWYTDIEMPQVAGNSYSPLVRLAVARVQMSSVTGRGLSETVAVEPVQLLPDRTLTLTRTGASVTAQLTGVGPRASTPNRVELAVERADSPGAEFTRLTDALEVPGWARVGAVSGALGEALTVAVEAGAAPHRLVVREFEQLDTDATAAGALGAALPTGPQAALTQRTVFVDVIPLL